VAAPGGAVGRLVVGGAAGIPDGRDMVVRANPARRRVGVGGGDVRHRGSAQPDGEARPRHRALPRRGGDCLAGGRVAL
jgi:hypothetical protein